MARLLCAVAVPTHYVAMFAAGTAPCDVPTGSDASDVCDDVAVAVAVTPAAPAAQAGGASNSGSHVPLATALVPALLSALSPPGTLPATADTAYTASAMHSPGLLRAVHMALQLGVAGVPVVAGGVLAAWVPGPATPNNAGAGGAVARAVGVLLRGE